MADGILLIPKTVIVAGYLDGVVSAKQRLEIIRDEKDGSDFKRGGVFMSEQIVALPLSI